MGAETTVFEFVGGMKTFEALVDAFYEGVEADPILRPMYPPQLDDSKRHTALFLAQYFGGPTTYSAERGHPRLRMRHAPFQIGPDERDRWLKHMLAALKTAGIPEPAYGIMANYFSSTATFLINAPTLRISASDGK
jgi:hemoglobin